MVVPRKRPVSAEQAETTGTPLKCLAMEHVELGAKEVSTERVAENKDDFVQLDKIPQRQSLAFR